MQRSLKDLSFCGKIQLPGYGKTAGKKYGLRKAKSYRGKPHDTHVRVFKKKKAQKVRKCKCFICGEEGHFARDCKRKSGNIARASVLEQLDLPADYDVVSVDNNESDSSAICSFSKGEMGFSAHEETIFMLGPEDCGWRHKVFVGQTIKDCNHAWAFNEELDEPNIKCTICKNRTLKKARAHCYICKATSCPLCSKFYFDIEIVVEKPTGKEKMRTAAISSNNLIKELMDYAKFLEAAHEEKDLERDLQKDFNSLKTPSHARVSEAVEEPLICNVFQVMSAPYVLPRRPKMLRDRI